MRAFGLSDRFRGPKTGRARLDLWIDVDGEIDVIELKYQTVALSATIDGESFALTNKGAEDDLGYDILNDLARMEHLARTVPRRAGHAILLSNGPIWKGISKAGEFNKDAFRIYEGRAVSGTLSWRDPAQGEGEGGDA